MTILGNTLIAKNVGGGGFTDPSDISGLKLWLDATDFDGVLSDTDPVSQWDDKSADLHSFVQAVGADQPVYNTGILNSKSGIYFDGGTSYMDEDDANPSVAQACTLIAVTSGTSIGTSYFMWSQSGQSTIGFNADAGTYSVFRIDCGSVYTGSGEDQYDSSGIINRFVFNGSSSEIHNRLVDKTSLNFGTDNFVYDRLGRDTTTTFTGYIHEIVLYDSIISGTDLTNLETYLKNKWGSGI